MELIEGTVGTVQQQYYCTGERLDLSLRLIEWNTSFAKPHGGWTFKRRFQGFECPE